ncbi:MAG: Fe-S cluster assembly scaffold protein NifU [Acutalibacteraceae bacterium]|nr:Fe-S cluster assembly scaffold protein NifU [Acutalibacteraceae bacterium]
MYTKEVMDHFEHPRNVGEIADADGIGQVGNPKCGDIMKMYIKVKDNVITDVKFKTYGCGSAIATSSIATEMIKGHTIDEALKLSNKAVVEALGGLPAHKIHCSVLAEQSIKAAIADYYTRQGIDPEPIVGKIPECEGHCDL